MNLVNDLIGIVIIYADYRAAWGLLSIAPLFCYSRAWPWNDKLVMKHGRVGNRGDDARIHALAVTEKYGKITYRRRKAKATRDLLSESGTLIQHGETFSVIGTHITHWVGMYDGKKPLLLKTYKPSRRIVDTTFYFDGETMNHNTYAYLTERGTLLINDKELYRGITYICVRESGLIFAKLRDGNTVSIDARMPPTAEADLLPITHPTTNHSITTAALAMTTRAEDWDSRATYMLTITGNILNNGRRVKFTYPQHLIDFAFACHTELYVV